MEEQNLVESEIGLETSLEDLGMASYAQLMDYREGKQCQCDGGGHAQFMVVGSFVLCFWRCKVQTSGPGVCRFQ